MKSSRIDLCLHAARKSATSAALQSVDLYVNDHPLSWF